MILAQLMAKGAEKPGLLDSLTPLQSLLGGLALVLVAAGLYWLAKKAEKANDDGSGSFLLKLIAMLVGLAGLYGVCRGLYGG